MIYNSKTGDINLTKLTRLYPAAVIEVDAEVSEMSLEWTDMNMDKIKLLHYVLVFDFTPIGSEIKDKKVLEFRTKDELIQTMTEVAQFFQK
jgi:hypothetical protein